MAGIGVNGKRKEGGKRKRERGREEREREGKEEGRREEAREGGRTRGGRRKDKREKEEDEREEVWERKKEEGRRKAKGERGVWLTFTISCAVMDPMTDCMGQASPLLWWANLAMSRSSNSSTCRRTSDQSDNILGCL